MESLKFEIEMVERLKHEAEMEIEKLKLKLEQGWDWMELKEHLALAGNYLTRAGRTLQQAKNKEAEI